jgi:hypothetical protein
MQHISFSIYEHGEVKSRTLQDLLYDKRVLFCSVNQNNDPLTIKYIRHLADKRELYQQAGVDEVYLVNSSFGKYFLIRANTVFDWLPALSDNDNQFVTYLAQQTGRTQSIDLLSKFWSYQALFSNGQLEQLYDQPTENQIDHLIAAGHSDLLDKHKHISKHNEDLIFRRPLFNFGPEQSYEVGGRLHFYNLWPNIALDKYLGITTMESQL